MFEQSLRLQARRHVFKSGPTPAELRASAELGGLGGYNERGVYPLL